MLLLISNSLLPTITQALRDAAAAAAAATSAKGAGAVRGPRFTTARRAAAAAASGGPGCNNGHRGARGLGEIRGIANRCTF